MDDNRNSENNCPNEVKTSDPPVEEGVGVEEEEEDDVVTMLDVLEEEQELEDNAFAVLAGSDDQNCTYLKGYMSRQALYACKTCRLLPTSADDTHPRAAICLACSYRCHDGHDLIELWTKRNVRCDCGNEKFAENKCKLYSKTSINGNNEYNHNFDGLYCVCLRPYPDLDSDVMDVMIQCIVCEDWFHGRHLENYSENNDSYDETICRNCMTRLPFLWYYYMSSAQSDDKLETNIENSETNEEIDTEDHNDLDPECEPSVVSETKCEPSVTSETKCEPSVVSETKCEPSVVSETKCEPSVTSKPNNGIEKSLDSVESSIKSIECKLQLLKSLTTEEIPKELSPAFWSRGWRKSLCQCKNCIILYNENKCLFLSRETDMVRHYERKGISEHKKVSHYDIGLNELKKMNRIQQIEYISGFNDLQNSLKEYLKTFAESNRTVREEDIREFFEQMQSRKRQKVDIPYNCK